ncbi:hypothetical protein ACFQ0M_08570 [Kitasatospora aburaviensis]
MNAQAPARAAAPQADRVDSAPDAAAASRAARQQHGRVEVAAARTAAAQTFANPDGTFTTELSPAPLGQEGRRLDRRRPDAAPHRRGHLRAAGHRQRRRALGRRLRPAGRAHRRGRAAARTVLAGEAPTPTADGAGLTYPDVLPSGVDLRLTVTPAGGVQEVLVVKNAAAAADPGLAALKLVTRTSAGLTLGQEDGAGLAVKDAAGRAVFQAPPARMWDSAGAPAAAPTAAKGPKAAAGQPAAEQPSAQDARPDTRSGPAGPGTGAHEAGVGTSVQDGAIGITPTPACSRRPTPSTRCTSTRCSPMPRPRHTPRSRRSTRPPPTSTPWAAAAGWVSATRAGPPRPASTAATSRSASRPV